MKTSTEKKAIRAQVTIHLFNVLQGSKEQGYSRLAYQIDDSKASLIARDAVGQSNVSYLLA